MSSSALIARSLTRGYFVFHLRVVYLPHNFWPTVLVPVENRSFERDLLVFMANALFLVRFDEVVNGLLWINWRMRCGVTGID
jgi:hypothetical protein